MIGIQTIQNTSGAWSVYIGRRLMFSSFVKSRALAYVEAFQ